MNPNTKPQESNYCFISGPVLSPTLLKAIELWNIPVYAQQITPVLPESINILKNREIASFIQDKDAVVIMNWEASLAFIIDNFPEQKLNQVNAFKNKAVFREVVKELYPNLFYQELTRDELQDFQFPESVNTVVLKPSLGTASIGIRTVQGQHEWKEAVLSVLRDIDKAKQQMNRTMLNDDSFLVEEFVDGDEFACDGFWDANGKTVITGIYQHPFASSLDVSDTVYYTSTKVVAETIKPTIKVLEHIGSKLGMRRFPFHFEFRLSNGNLFPIELNPLRFGQVALPDITEYAFGFNPYDLFFTDKAPDWDSLLNNDSNSRVYAFVLADIPEKYQAEKYSFDEEGFCNSFGEKLLNYLPSNPEVTPFFGVAHVVGDSVGEVLEYLNLDFEGFLKSRE
ncbi:MAG: ATP-grasp domain-containing protein [Cyanobacteria bacterium J06643_5]